MPKGNHVFNNFENVIHKAFKAVLANYNLDRELDAVNGSGGDIDKAKLALNAKFANAFKFYTELRDHALTHAMHDAQDDEAVAPDDPNSIAFGEKSEEFVAALVKWSWGDDSVDVGDLWRQLINIGFDQAAATSYIEKGSSANGAAKQPAERRAHIEALQQFVRGEMTKIAINFMLAVRFDLKLANAVDYEGKPAAWKAKLLGQAANAQ